MGGADEPRLAGFIALLIAAAGCVSQPPTQEPVVLDVKAVVDYYPLGGYTQEAGEMFYVIPGDIEEVKEGLREIVVEKAQGRTSFPEGENLNLVVFRGVFNTGGYGVKISRVEKRGNTFHVHAVYTDPGRGMMVTQAFTQPTAIIPLGTLPKGSYEAVLKVTKVLKTEKEEKILEEGKEHARFSFRVTAR